MTESIIERIVRLYELAPKHISAPQKGYRNESWRVETEAGNLNVIVYKREPEMLARIRRADNIAAFLHEKGFPTRVPINDRIIKMSSSNGDRYARAYNYLPGDTIPWEAYTMKHIKLLGKTMSDMHAALKYHDASQLAKESNVVDEYCAIVARMEQYFEQISVVNALQEKLDLSVNKENFSVLKQTLAICKRLSFQQALHMDFVRSNILFDSEAADDPAITGILDFEKTAYGHPIVDIARTLAFLLVDCKYKDADKVRKYFLWSGYHKRGTSTYRPIRINGEDLLHWLVDLFLFYDFYKFLKHNPYEFLSQNEHFIRTRDELLVRQLLSAE
jgi:Ser/Thr protein kinase RdoA (MazF antagonist)